jgi:hypothetical protein
LYTAGTNGELGQLVARTLAHAPPQLPYSHGSESDEVGVGPESDEVGVGPASDEVGVGSESDEVGVGPSTETNAEAQCQAHVWEKGQGRNIRFRIQLFS